MPDDPLSRSGRGVYGISVASELSGIEPQTLRPYERRGLLAPARTDGGTRRYSDHDLDRLQRITDLVAQGVNIAGILQILNLEHDNTNSNPTTASSSRKTRGYDPPIRPPKGERASDDDQLRYQRGGRRGESLT